MGGDPQRLSSGNIVASIIEEASLLEYMRDYAGKLEVAIINYIHEAHTKTLDGVDICDHSAVVCFCAYHDSLDYILNLLRDSGNESNLIAEVRRK